MNQLAPHTGHLFPGYHCMPLANRRWNLFRRFADDLKGSDHGVNGLLVLSELGPCHAGNELFDMPGSLLNVRHLVEKLPTLLHRPITSRRMCRPMRGLSVSFIARSTFTPSLADK